jgi:hypothetical protein
MKFVDECNMLPLVHEFAHKLASVRISFKSTGNF